MESSKLYTEIENIIRTNLQYAYNKNTQKVTFNLSETFPDGEILSFYNFSIGIEKQHTSLLKQSYWRIPQTRMYLSTLSNPDFKISELRFFNTSVILIKNFTTGSLKFPFRTSTLLLEANGKEYIKKEIILSANENLILCSDGLLGDSENIVTVINQLIDKERKLNPLDKIFSTDITMLKSVDSYWADIQWASPNEVETDINGDTVVSETMSLILSELSIYTTLNFKNRQRVTVTSEQAQEMWNILSLPALRFKLIYLIKSKPWELISLLLTAYENNFWWADKARDLVQENMRIHLSAVLSLFNLLFTLKSTFNLTNREDLITVSNYLNDLPNSTYSLMTRLCSLKYSRSKNKSYTCAVFNDLNAIVIDKKARIVYNVNTSYLEIYPQTYQYDLNSIYKLTIHIDSVFIDIALVWKDFVVSYGNLRFKFLFKKNRYQISIKGDTGVLSLNINKQKLSFEKSKYLRFYYTPDETDAKYNIYFTDQDGRSISDQNTINPLILNVVAQNKYGQLIENLHIRKRNSNKNRTLYPPGSGRNKINSGEMYDLIIPKSEIAVVQPGFNQSVLTKVLYTHCSILAERLCIFVKNEESIDLLRQEFYNTFGFLAVFQLLEDIRIVFGAENIVIADTPLSGELTGSFSWHDEILVKRSGQKKVIYFTEKNFRKWMAGFIV